MVNEPSDDPPRLSVLAVSCRFLRSSSMRDCARLIGLMHACLNVGEIVTCIVCELGGSKTEVIAVALACCHKNFEDPEAVTPGTQTFAGRCLEWA